MFVGKNLVLVANKLVSSSLISNNPSKVPKIPKCTIVSYDLRKSPQSALFILNVLTASNK